MKYLKTFESVDLPYEKITHNEWYDIVYGESTRIVPTEFEKIKLALGNYDEIKMHRNEYFDFITYNYKHVAVDINQLPDEYYCVHLRYWGNGREWYKCDQLYGLSECIKMIISKR